MNIPGHSFNNRFSVFDHLCSECNLFVCYCNALGFNKSSILSCSHSSSEQESQINRQISSEIITRENHRANDNFQSSTLQNDNTDESTLDLKLCNKGMNTGFLNVQGLCLKFSEIHDANA